LPFDQKLFKLVHKSRIIKHGLTLRFNVTVALIYLDPNSKLNLQGQIRQKLVEGMLNGAFPAGTKLPSSRKLAKQLGVARNTVVLAYEQLIEEGYLESRQRSGIFVSRHILEGRVGFQGNASNTANVDQRWIKRIRLNTEQEHQFHWPANWQQFPFPFIDGHFDSSLYPAAQWREASRLALGTRIIDEGQGEEGHPDHPALIEEIRTKMLPRRGITAQADEILITLGGQNALYLLSRLLIDSSTSVSLEEPGNPNVRQLIHQAGAKVINSPVDEHGLVINTRLNDAQVIYVTPSHQIPTAVTMPNQRRRGLLRQASEHDQIIIEDDLEHENNYLGQPHAALRGIDKDNRVIYVSALPKVLAPGLRIGFIVAAPEVIRQARRLRQIVIGRPSMLTQRTAAFFLSLGHYDAFMTRLHKIMGERWEALRQALNHYLRDTEIELPTQGGTALWVHCPAEIAVESLVTEAAKRGILIEPDSHFYSSRRRQGNYFRLGVTSIPERSIREGVNQLTRLIRDLCADQIEYLDDNNPDLLGGEKLREIMSGAIIMTRTFYSGPCTIQLHPNGSMTGRAGHTDEERDTGKWWVEDDTWCRQWKHWGYGDTSKLQVTLKDDHIRWWRPGGRLVDSGILQRKTP
jgi:GntR family transcriptional regulator/MocR family aminotransferase